MLLKVSPSGLQVRLTNTFLNTATCIRSIITRYQSYHLQWLKQWRDSTSISSSREQQTFYLVLRSTPATPETGLAANHLNPPIIPGLWPRQNIGANDSKVAT